MLSKKEKGRREEKEKKKREKKTNDTDFSRAKKKPCLDDRDTNSPLDKDRDTMPGPEERSSRPGQ